MTCCKFDVDFTDDNQFDVTLRGNDNFNVSFAGSGGTLDYEDLIHKPRINGVELIGDVDSDDLGITVPTKTSDLLNDSGYITEDDIPPLVTDLGEIDPEEYDYDVNTFINTLIDSGWYFFFFDEFTYFAQVQSFGDNNSVYVNQHVWSNEENPSMEYVRGLYIEDGEVVDELSNSYITYEDASSAFATKTHAHFDTKNAAMSVLDWCDSNALTFDNAKPFVLYTDTLNSTNWIIERYATVRSPNYRFIKVYDMSDASHFYIRSGSLVGNTTTWGAWREYTVTADENVKQQYQAEGGYSYWRPLLVGKSAGSSEGFTPSTVTDQTYAFKTLECQPSTGTIRMGVASMFKGSYESKISPDTLTADRTITIPDKSGTLALTSDITGGGMSITVNGTDYPITAITLTTISGVEGVLVEYDDGNNGQLFFADGVGLAAVKSAIESGIPHDTSELTNGAGFLTISDLPVYNGGVS